MPSTQINTNELFELIKDNITQAIAPILIQLNSLTDSALQSDRSLRGNNGTIGVIARVEKVEAALKELKEKVEITMGDENLKRIAKVMIDESRETIRTRSTDENSITKAEIFNKVILPIIIASIIYFLFTVMPKIFGLINF